MPLQVRTAGEHESENRRQQEQERKQRYERVVGEQRSKVDARVVDELVYDSQWEPARRMAALESIQTGDPTSSVSVRTGRERC